MGFLEDHIMICRIPKPTEEEPDRYEQTFLEAMGALAEGKRAMCKDRSGVFYEKDGRIMCDDMGDSFVRYWFNEDELYSMWKVVG